MGNSPSLDKIPGGGTEGYHVVQVQDNSPSSKCGLEPFFDYLVGINGVRLNRNDAELKKLLQENMDKPTKLTVYSSKDQSVRDVIIIPTENWGGSGLLGASISFCSFEGAEESVFHVLDVQPGSPAATAGLMPSIDFIIGADSPLYDMDDFNDFIARNDKKRINLFVYNVETQDSRQVQLTPNRDWGGEGMLGCGIGYGYLHRIPASKRIEAPTSVAVHTPTKQDGFAEVPLTSPSFSVPSGTVAQPAVQVPPQSSPQQPELISSQQQQQQPMIIPQQPPQVQRVSPSPQQSVPSIQQVQPVHDQALKSHPLRQVESPQQMMQPVSIAPPDISSSISISETQPPPQNSQPLVVASSDSSQTSTIQPVELKQPSFAPAISIPDSTSFNFQNSQQTISFTSVVETSSQVSEVSESVQSLKINSQETTTQDQSQ